MSYDSSPTPSTGLASPRGKVLLIYTGGTIGMGCNPRTHALEPLDFNHLVDNLRVQISGNRNRHLLLHPTRRLQRHESAAVGRTGEAHF